MKIKLLLFAILLLIPDLVFAQQIDHSGSGSGSSSITANSTATSGCGANGVMFSGSSKVQCDTGFTYAGSGGAITLNTANLLSDATSRSYYFGINAGNGDGAAFTDNVGIGYHAMAGVLATPNPNTAPGGINNVALGSGALENNTSGYGNVAIGHTALQSSTTGIYNDAIGNFALTTNTTGSFNQAIGDRALQLNVSGNNNIAIGYLTLAANTVDYNTGVGHAALSVSTTGTSNVAIGALALTLNTTGSNNNAVGRTSLATNTTGSQNDAFGFQALGANLSGTYNVAFGFDALATNSTGTQNAAFGPLALLLATGNNNSAVGYNTLRNVSSGASNTAIGNGTGLGITTGSNNTVIGAGVTGLAAGLSDAIILATGEGTIRADFGNTSTGWNFQGVVTDATLTDTTMCITTAGAIFKGSGTAGICLGNVSSIRFKDAWSPLDDGLSVIMALNPGTWRYKPGVADGGERLQIGFLAEDYARVLPDWTRYDDQHNPNGVDLLAVLPQTVRAIQQLKADNDNLRAEVETLRRSIAK